VDIHIVDDDGSLRDLYEEFSEALGYKAKTFISAENYLDHTNNENYTAPKLVVFTDLEMPNMSGYKLISEIRKKNPMQRFILATGNPNNPIQQDNHLCFYLTKPVRLEHMKKVLNALSLCTKLGPDEFCTDFDCGSLSDLDNFNINDWRCPNKNK
jgi:FixJ family two-component response regulator